MHRIIYSFCSAWHESVCMMMCTCMLKSMRTGTVLALVCVDGHTADDHFAQMVEGGSLDCNMLCHGCQSVSQPSVETQNISTA